MVVQYKNTNVFLKPQMSFSHENSEKEMPALSSQTCSQLYAPKYFFIIEFEALNNSRLQHFQSYLRFNSTHFCNHVPPIMISLIMNRNFHRQQSCYF